MTVLPAALAYWAAIFAAGFVLGTLRVLVLVPGIGETWAVLLELPVMLVLSWLVAVRIVRRWRLATPESALAAGAIAFALLMGAEAVLAIALSGLSLAEWIASLLRLPGALGLAGQLAFGFMPLLASRRAARAVRP